MISLGKNITTAGDTLQKYSLKMICDAIRNPKPELQNKIRQLRRLRDIDAKQYTAAKKALPYVVCGIFNTSLRRSDDFAYTEYFIIDIDHLADKELDIAQTKAKIIADDRVVACFVSPGGDGLKVFFKLSERCYDKGMYARFYKIFAANFATAYGITQAVDMKTCDVARACFVSHDPEIYFNPSPNTVRISDFLNLVDIDAQSTALREAEKKVEATPKQKEHRPDPDKEALEKIRATLDPKLAKKIQNRPPVYVPQILNDIIEGIQKNLEEKGVIVTEIRDIQYGKKVGMRIGLKEAEVNIFHGKRGFSIVKTPRSGTDDEMNTLMVDVITAYIYSL